MSLWIFLELHTVIGMCGGVLHWQRNSCINLAKSKIWIISILNIGSDIDRYLVMRSIKRYQRNQRNSWTYRVKKYLILQYQPCICYLAATHNTNWHTVQFLSFFVKSKKERNQDCVIPSTNDRVQRYVLGRTDAWSVILSAYSSLLLLLQILAACPLHFTATSIPARRALIF